ncbi:hypothetical protein H2200_000394 [Cladophialophora chaetospira]|uniref:Apple domain-containing protein n=1 Tax=Cladophialophora chaetospira TaxID=386627 RepID=A0AA39CQA7_9EURO|nr:hypothetical protein H2200_000394 [Cladophialophora chaetospira]
MASSDSTHVASDYSDKQVVSGIDHGKEVVVTQQPYPDAYAYDNPTNANNDGSRAGAAAGGEEAFNDHLLPGNEGRPAWSEQKPKRRICGLSRKSFIIVIAVVTALVVAGIIGGSVGGVLASKSSSGGAQADLVSTSSTTTAAATSAPASTSSFEALTSSGTTTSSLSTSTTSSSATATPTSGEGTYNCPSDNDRSYTSPLSSTQEFTIFCDTDWPSGMDGFRSGTVTDLTAVVAYSIDACIDQCVAYNVAGGSCGAVTYGANITLALSRGGIQGNCFLKDQRGASNVGDDSGQVEAAFLSSSS